MKPFWVAVAFLSGLLPLGLVGPARGEAPTSEKTAQTPARPRKIVLLAGKKSHGPGVHEYEKSVRLLKVMLDRAENLRGIKTEYHLNGWPADPRTLDDSDTIMTVSDGQDGDLYSPVPWMTPERMAVMERQMRRGCGFITFHFSTFAPDREGQKVLDWGGGYFDWQDDAGRRDWYSQIKTLEADVTLGERSHPVLRGVAPFRLREEFYYRMRFRDGDRRLKPILLVPALAKATQEQIVAWAVERADGGRGFCTTCGHFYDNWENESFRRLILNALVWTAGAEVPAEGVKSRYYSDQEVGEWESERVGAQLPIRAVAVTGQQHPAHAWRETTLALEDLLRRDPRIRLTTVPDPEFLGDEKLRQHDVVVLNYCNWERPGLSERAKAGFVNYLKNGGGLILIHFSNGAFHFSLPKAGDSDWPEFRKICRRVWDHTPGKSGHDAYGRFRVEIAKTDHRITPGLASYETTDELYFEQQGSEPIEVLATARSKVTGRDEPMAFVYTYGNGRVFQTVLGHDAASLRVPGTASLIRRAAAWVTRREVRALEGEGVPARSHSPTVSPSHGASTSDNEKPTITGHWGETAIGFRWQESDSADARWNEMDNGSFMASSVATPFGDAGKGLTIRLGDTQQASICYDTGRMAVRAAWTGGFLRFDPARFGLIKTPTIAGKMQFGTRDGAGWGAAAVRFNGHAAAGQRVVLHYRVDDAAIVESPWIETAGDTLVFRRAFNVAAHRGRLATAVCQDVGAFSERRIEDARLFVAESQSEVVAAAIAGDASAARLRPDGKTGLALDIASQTKPGRFALLVWRGRRDHLPKFARRVSGYGPIEDPAKLAAGINPAARIRWKHRPVTRGVVSAEKGPYVVDTLTLPLDNPYKALFFCTGHDFFKNGDAAVCTIHGDVWRASGIDQRLEKLTWTRFATGLYQPLGLRIVDDAVYVLGRDQITRLHDRDGNGEADWYENFNNQGETSSFGHDYATCLETDRAGNFYYLRCHNTDGKKAGLYRVSRDGARIEQIASGIRNPNGLGVGPDDTITVAPQEGEWTPGSCILEVRPGGHYGYQGPMVTPRRPLGYDPPLCWIPRIMDNSTGGQVWVSGDRFGPLAGQLINFSYGRCWPMIVLREKIGDVAQGGTVKLDVNFLSGACRGRFRPQDGQLYVTGLRGWTTSAVHDGCFQRVRYTGAKVYLPISLSVHRNGLLLKFAEPLDRVEAEDADNYSIEAWNYRYSSAYGSADYKPSADGIEGHDETAVRSATLMPDGRSVFIEIPDVRPVMQMAIRLTLTAADGAPIRQTIFNTINVVPDTQIAPGTHKRPPRPGDLVDDLRARLKPGAWQQFLSHRGESLDVRHGRKLSCFVAADESPTPFVPPRGWSLVTTGYLRIASKGEFRFHVVGNVGGGELLIDGQTVARLSDHSGDLVRGPIVLRRGHHRFSLVYAPPNSHAAHLRVYWSGEAFPFESVPSTVLFYDPQEPPAGHDPRRREGLALFATHQCARCHALPAGVAGGPFWQPEIALDPPRLAGVGRRLHTHWIADWILDPRSQQPGATMPAVLGGPGEQQRQQAGDIAAYLGTLDATTDAPRAKPPDDVTDDDGEALYENLGCIKCHTRERAAAADAYGRTSLAHVARKYRREGLVAYLRQPQRHHPATKMPEFHLTHSESTALAEFLLAPAGPSPNAAAKGDPVRGKELFARVECNSCHAVDDGRPTAPHLPTIFGSAPARRGCLADEANRGRAPRFALSDGERESLRRFLSSDPQSLVRSAPLDAAAHYISALSCRACHTRDHVASPGPRILLDEGSLGRPPDVLPDLTLAGEKIRPDWALRLLTGEERARCRPWLAARMPAFPAYGRLLAAGLAAEHGIRHKPDALFPDANGKEPSVDSNLVELGRRLTLKEGGLDCRQCHGLGGEVLKVQNDAQGIGFAFSAKRLRREYYDRWMRDPLRIDPLTKMPTFSPDGVHSPITNILGGDAPRQFEAMWQYMQSVRPDGVGTRPTVGDPGAPGRLPRVPKP